MKYSEPLPMQLFAIVLFLGVGFLLGAWYSVCAWFRYLFSNGKAATIVCDLVFWIGVFWALFVCFLSYTNGIWRLPSLCFCAVGFFVFRRTIGQWLRQPLLLSAKWIRACGNRLFLPVIKLKKIIEKRKK